MFGIVLFICESTRSKKMMHHPFHKSDLVSYILHKSHWTCEFSKPLHLEWMQIFVACPTSKAMTPLNFYPHDATVNKHGMLSRCVNQRA